MDEAALEAWYRENKEILKTFVDDVPYLIRGLTGPGSLSINSPKILNLRKVREALSDKRFGPL